MNPESEGVNPVGLYRNPNTKAEIGCLDPAQGDAVVRQGFVLVRRGLEAAKQAGVTEAAPAPKSPEETK